jgi:hypothetical protein
MLNVIGQNSNNLYYSKFQNIEKSINYNTFNFGAKWADFEYQLDNITDDDSDFLLKCINNIKINDSNLVFKFKDKNKFNGFEFDDVFLNITSIPIYNSYVHKLFFIKKFTNDSSAKKFNKNLIEILSLKFGKYSISNNFIQWYGNQIYSNVTLKDENVILEFGTYMAPYSKSLFKSYDYFYTSDLFKAIDNDNSFKGLLFGTHLSSIKQTVNLTKVEDYQRVINYETNNKKYLIWNSLFFDNVEFWFSKELKLSDVIIVYNISNDLSSNDFENKLMDILGTPSRHSNDFSNNTIWYGKNLKIILIKHDDSKFCSLMISSLKYNPFIDKEY